MENASLKAVLITLEYLKKKLNGQFDFVMNWIYLSNGHTSRDFHLPTEP